MDSLVARGRSKERNSGSNSKINKGKSKFKEKGKKGKCNYYKKEGTTNLIVLDSKKRRKSPILPLMLVIWIV